MISRKQFLIFKLLAVICLLVEIANLVITMINDPTPYWREYGASLIYILMFFAMFVMLSRINPSDLQDEANSSDDKKT